MTRSVSKLGWWVLALGAVPAWAEEPIWRWTDDGGSVNYTNDPATIPESQRAKATQTEGAELSVVHKRGDTPTTGPASTLIESGPAITLDLPESSAKDAGAAAPAQKTYVRQVQLFSATWCEPCKLMKKARTLEQLVEAHPELKLVEIDADAQKERAEKIGLITVPTVLFLDAKGRELGRVTRLRDLKGFEAALEKANRAVKK